MLQANWKGRRMRLLLFMFLFVSSNAIAGEFRIHCFYDQGRCSALITDIVSDRFLARYPPDKWQIIVISEVHRFSNGGGTAFAVTGVSPFSSGSKSTSIPAYRFSSVVNVPGPRQLTSRESVDELEGVVRRAVESMMTACETSRECRLH